jgi:hypothetical protein
MITTPSKTYIPLIMVALFPTGFSGILRKFATGERVYVPSNPRGARRRIGYLPFATRPYHLALADDSVPAHGVQRFSPQ